MRTQPADIIEKLEADNPDWQKKQSLQEALKKDSDEFSKDVKMALDPTCLPVWCKASLRESQKSTD